MKCLQEIYLTSDTVNDDYVYFTDIYFKENDFVESGEIIAVFESSKASIDIEAEESGFLKILFDLDSEKVEAGSKVFEIYDKEISGSKKIKTSKKTIDKTKDILISKSVKDRNIDLSDYSEYDIVTKYQLDNNNDNLNNDESLLKTTVIENHESLNKTSMSIEKLSPTKITEGEFLVKSNFSPISQLTSLVQCPKPNSSVLKFISYECSRLLIKYPNLNSCFSSNSVIKYDQINIGIAFDDGVQGLKVIALKNADKLEINEIEDKLLEMSIKYEKNVLSTEDLTSSTFTITDLYNSDTVSFKPLLNIENSAILGISSYTQSLNGFMLELSFDHRILSGLEISKFLTELKHRLQNHFGNFEKDNHSSCLKCGRSLEEDLDGAIFFLKTINKGSNCIICSNCLNGW